MKLEVIIVFAVTVASVALAQGFGPSTGLQYNPIFNGQNPALAKNVSQYNPFFNYWGRNSTNRGPWDWGLWERLPFYSYFFGGGRSARTERALGGFPYYAVPAPSSCIPNYRQCNGSHSVFQGCLTSWDKLLFNRCYVKTARWWGKREKIINYPRDFLTPGLVRNDTITAIRIWDQKCNGTGGYAHILPGGGVGHNNVSVRLYTDVVNKGFNFCVQLFGRANFG